MRLPATSVYLSIAVAVMGYHSAAAQSSTVRFEKIPLGADSGASRVNAIISDSRGAVWIATYGGLFRYDRSGTRAYRHDKADSTSLTGNRVFSLREDRTGDLWVGTHGAGLNRMRRGQSTFTRYPADSTTPFSTNRAAILSIFEDHEGNLWFGTLGGRVFFDSARGSFSRIWSPSISSDAVWPIARTADGAFWFGTLGGGLIRSDTTSKPDEIFRKDSTSPTALQSDLVVSLLVDRKGNLWVGTDGGGLYRPRKVGDGFDHLLGNATVLSIAEGQDGTLWIATYGNGLVHLDATGVEIERFRSDPAVPASLPSNRLRALAFDRDGTLWVGTHDAGVLRMLRQQASEPPRR